MSLVESQVRLALVVIPNVSPPPFSESVPRHVGRALSRISRYRHPLFISSNTNGLPHGFQRILRAKQRGRILSETPNVERVRKLTASRLAPRGHGTR